MTIVKRQLLLRSAMRWVVGIAFLSSVSGAQAPPVIGTMAANEVAARKQGVRYQFVAEERSDRTGGHLWREKVVETDDGPLRRLVAIDGKGLDAAAAASEDARIKRLVENPDLFRQENAAHKDDEEHATRLLILLPKAFIITPDGEQNGCARFKFRPDPSYQPSTYEERVAHAMVGSVSLKQPMNRLCEMQATIAAPVEFGFGLFGKVAQGGNFRLKRTPVDSVNWKSAEIHVDISGRILMLKTLAQKQDTVRTEIRVVPSHLTVKQAASML